MSTERKFTEEELAQIKQIQDDNTRIIFQLGEIDLELRVIEQRTQDLQNLRNTVYNDYAALHAKETEIVRALTEKYGVGQVDLASGTFIAD